MGKLVQSATDNARIKAVLLGAKVKVIDEDGVNDPATVMYDLKTTLAAEEYKLIRSRTMAGKARLAREGKYAKGGLPPYGYSLAFANKVDRKNGFLVVEDPECGACLRRILWWFVEGGLAHAARMADKAKIPTRYGKPWDHATVNHYVGRASSYHTGEWRREMAGEPITVHYPPLIDAKLYQAVERRRREHKPTKARLFLATGFVDCTCGAHLQTLNSRRRAGGSYFYSGCRAGCGRVDEDRFARTLWMATVLRLIEIRDASTAPERTNGTASLKTARARVEALSAQIAQLLDLHLKGLDKTVWQERNDMLNEQKAMARAELARMETEIKSKNEKKEAHETLKQKIDRIIDTISSPKLTLDDMRATIREVLAGARVKASWPARKVAEIRMPAIEALGLEEQTMRTDSVDMGPLSAKDAGTLFARIVRDEATSARRRPSAAKRSGRPGVASTRRHAPSARRSVRA
jgi:DNA invertase Pin-like site-specific DNA recombinase